MPNIRILSILMLQLATNCLSAVVASPVDNFDYLKGHETAASPLDQASYFEQSSPNQRIVAWDRAKERMEAVDVVKKPSNAMNKHLNTMDKPLNALKKPLNIFLKPSIIANPNLTLSQAPTNVANVAYCMRCVKPVMLAARAAIVSGNGYERFINICQRINELFMCMEVSRRRCVGTNVVEKILDGYKFMCFHQYKAYKKLADCLDINSNGIRKGCYEECHITNDLAGWFVYGYMRSTTLMSIPEGLKPSKVNVLYFRYLSKRVCEMLSCLLRCVKIRYDKKCGGIGGAMVLEVFLRPFVTLYESWAMNPIVTALKLTLPNECSYITNDDGYKGFRLSPEQHERVQNYSSGTSLFDFVYGGPESRTVPELREKLTSLMSRDRHVEIDDNFVRYPVPTTVKPNENENRLGELEERIMELRTKDERQRNALAVSNDWDSN